LGGAKDWIGSAGPRRAAACRSDIGLVGARSRMGPIALLI
jgi:hypothetical protein